MKPTVQSTVVLACFYINDDCDTARSKLISIGSGTVSAGFELKGLEDGQYALIAWKDQNGNQKVDGDLIAVYLENNNLGLVRPPKSGLNLTMTFLQGFASFGAKPLEVGRVARWFNTARR